MNKPKLILKQFVLTFSLCARFKKVHVCQFHQNIILILTRVEVFFSSERYKAKRILWFDYLVLWFDVFYGLILWLMTGIIKRLWSSD